MTQKKEPIPLNPIIEEQKPLINIPENSNIEGEEIELDDNSGDSESFFKNAFKLLFGRKNISTKTEYLNVMENFTGTKLEFLSKYGNMPYLSEFLEIFETKRVSLKRRGRQEIIMALQQREQEIEQNKDEKIKRLLGL